MSAVTVLIKLKPGWALDPLASAFRRGARRLPPVLPAGARLEPALRLYAEAHPTEAEREITRFVLLHHPGPAGDALALARGWACVARADLN